jgi:DNA primase
MAKTIFEEINDELDMEFFFQSESLPYKMGRGTSGEQINAKHCPNPECGDSRWRTYFGVETGRGNCFVCNASFNKVSFLHAYYGHGDKEWRLTVEKAKEILRSQGWRPRRTVTAAVDHGEVKLPYSIELPTPEGENLAYLRERGVTDELTAYFRLRYCEFGWWDFEKDGDKKQQWFSNRVIIPVFDLDGSLVTFQGRDLLGKRPGQENYNKYLFPIGLPGTGRFLYNGHNVQLTKEVAMGEGAFDVIALKAAFDEEVSMRHIVPIGSFGKHLSYGASDGNDQLGRFLKLKALGVTTVTIMWDGEEAALISALNAAKHLTGIGLVARIALLPADKDPNEVLPEVVREAYWKASVWTPKLDLLWRLKNPYSKRQKLPVSAD